MAKAIQIAFASDSKISFICPKAALVLDTTWQHWEHSAGIARDEHGAASAERSPLCVLLTASCAALTLLGRDNLCSWKTASV